MEEDKDINQLINLTLSGNKLAFGELYDLTITHTYKSIHFLLDQKSDVEDVVQETYIQIFKNLNKFDQSKPFKPWITGIAIKQVQSYRRKKWMGMKLLKKAEQTEQMTVIEHSEAVMNSLFNETLTELVLQLPFKLRQVIILRYLSEHSQEEVASILNIPLGTVKSRTNAALKKLKEKGQNENIFYEEARNIL